jgi:hypothetical protein
MQDNEIAAYYRDAQVKYGSENVLGIVAESSSHLVSKREVPSESDDDKLDKESEKFIYEAIGRNLVWNSGGQPF